MGYAEAYIEGIDEHDFYGHSRIYETNQVPGAEFLGDNVDAKGTIKLFTERDTCSSCNQVIKDFSEKY